MIKLNRKISDLSAHLQTLISPKYYKQVQEATEKKDDAMLIAVCKTAKIPSAYIGSVVSVVMSVSPQKWRGEGYIRKLDCFKKI